MSGEAIYHSSALAIAMVVLWAIGFDIILWAKSEPTISQWLREHPRWLIGPLAGSLIFFAVLLVHIFFATD